MNIIFLLLKGVAMGAANIIPGVSGGTIALVTGIYERLIEAMKSFDLQSAKLFFKGRWGELASKVQLPFLLPLLAGVVVGILGFARLLESWLAKSEVTIMALFFGLILASAWLVGKTVPKWNISAVVLFVLGLAVAVACVFFKPASENSSFFYLLICGAAAFCSMIIPGLSGSFVLLLMGNYLLVLSSVNDFSAALKGLDIAMLINLGTKIILPLALGAVLGLLLFSRLLSWLFAHHRGNTLAGLTGFIVGSLVLIYPWKIKQYLSDQTGQLITRADGEKVISGYSFKLPDFGMSENLIALALLVAGAIAVFAVEKIGASFRRSE